MERPLTTISGQTLEKIRQHSKSYRDEQFLAMMRKNNILQSDLDAGKYKIEDNSRVGKIDLKVYQLIDSLDAEMETKVRMIIKGGK